MRTMRYYAKGNRTGKILHIETDGGIVNIRVGLSDNQGRPVTAIEIIPDDEQRGGDGNGQIWRLDGCRLVMQQNGDEGEGDPEPSEDDAWVVLDEGVYRIRVFGADTGPFPTRHIAIYELAAAMVKHGEFPSAWVFGEHGPAVEEISDQVDKFFDESGELRLLTGVRFDDGAQVLLTDDAHADWRSYTVIRDYGQLGLYVHTTGDPTITELITDPSIVRKFTDTEV